MSLHSFAVLYSELVGSSKFPVVQLDLETSPYSWQKSSHGKICIISCPSSVWDLGLLGGESEVESLPSLV